MEQKKTKGGEAANTFSLPFALQKEVGCGTKSHEVNSYGLDRSERSNASGVDIDTNKVLPVNVFLRCA